MSGLPQLAISVAQSHGLDPTLVCAVVEQESGWNQWAIRFEPRFEARYVDPKNLGDTETKARSISWGLMQIMGEVARELGYTSHLAALCDPATGLEWGCRKLAECLKGRTTEQALQHWNGGGNLAYASQVIARMSKYANPSS